MASTALLSTTTVVYTITFHHQRSRLLNLVRLHSTLIIHMALPALLAPLGGAMNVASVGPIAGGWFAWVQATYPTAVVAGGALAKLQEAAMTHPALAAAGSFLVSPAGVGLMAGVLCARRMGKI